MAIVGASLMSSAVFAQTVQPKSGSTTTTVNATNWMTHLAADQWSASKLIGLSVLNNDDQKIGSISELIVDRSGKLEAVVVGVGGFLGLGEHYVAVPYSQIKWVDRTSNPPLANTAPATTGAANTDRRSSEIPPSYPDNRAEAVIDAANMLPYPDHAVLDMTKDQLKAAPAFKFSPERRP
jgi:sporulation protein YlmC with PRC-barrel domain